MQIRKAKVRDIKEIYPHFIKFKIEILKFFNPEFKKYRKEIKPSSEIKLYLKKKINSKNNLFLIALENNKIVGFLNGVIQKRVNSIYKDLIYGELEHVFVIKGERHHHIMSSLKEEVFKFFKKNKCAFYEVHVYPKNTSKKIYKHWGFKPYLENMRMK